MKKLFVILSLAIATLAVSCSEDKTTDELPTIGGNGSTDSTVDGDQPMKYITVGIDNGTRISLGKEENGIVPIYWSTGDQLLVNKTTKSSKITSEYNGKETAVIGVPDDTTYPMTLVYPAAVSKGAKWCYIDSNQAYDANHIANGYGILMGVAESADDMVTMEHKCGYMKVSLTGSTTVKTVILRAIGHEPLTGYFRYPTTSATDGKIDLNNFNGTDALANGYFDSPVIFTDCGEGVALSGEATDFYFALPARTYSKGFALTVIDTNNKQHRVQAYTSGKTVNAGALIKMQPLSVDCTEDVGIYNGNELAGYVRTLEKNLWLNGGTELHLRSKIDLSNEDFTDITAALSDARTNGELFYYRTDASDTYNCGAITLIDGHNNAITGYNSTVSGASAGLLFHEIPATLTVKDLQLGETADDPATTTNEADCTLTATGDGSTNEFAAFCYKLSGKISNCKSYAKVAVSGSGALYAAGMCGSTSTGTIESSTNYGYIYCNGSAASDGNVIVAGIVPSGNVTISTCVNEGAITCDSPKVAARIAGIIGISGSNGISGVTNKGAITLNTPGIGSRVGGIVASSTVAITSCVNEGNINVPESANVLHVGGVAGYSSGVTTTSTNKGNINVKATAAVKIFIGGVVGYDACADSTLDGCVNGEEETQKGAITITHNGGGNVYAGGVHGYSEEAKAYTNMTNYGPITISGDKIAYAYIGCVGGYNNISGTSYSNCNNYGDFLLNATSTEPNFNYIGGISGANSNNRVQITNCGNYGDMTFDTATMKVRVGGLAGNLSYLGNAKNNRCEFDITVNATAASSNFGGFAGYMPKPSSGTAVIEACYYKGTMTNNANVDSSVLFGAVFALSQTSICRDTKIEPTFVSTAGSPSFALVGGSAGAGNTLTVGGNNKPFSISKKTNFLGINVVSADNVTNHNTDEGAAGKAYIDNTSTLANKYTVTLKNVAYVDSID